MFSTDHRCLSYRVIRILSPHYECFYQAIFVLLLCHMFLCFLTGLVDDDGKDPPETDVPVISGQSPSSLETFVATGLSGDQHIYSA